MSVTINSWNQGFVSDPNNKNLRNMNLEFSVSVSMPVVNEGIDQTFVTLACVPTGTSLVPVNVKIPFSMSSVTSGMSGLLFSWTCDLYLLLKDHVEYGFFSRDSIGTKTCDISITPTITLDGEDGSGGSLNFTSSAGAQKFSSCYSIYRPSSLVLNPLPLTGSGISYKVTR